MGIATTPTSRTSDGRVHRFALVDESGRPIGVFESHRRGWRIGDWLLTRDGRRLQIIGVLPAEQRDDVGDACEVWLVEPA
jgi:hypothetical protein